MGHQGYTHFHQHRIRGPPRPCQRIPGGVTVEDVILLCQMINHVLWNPQMLRVHSEGLEGRAGMVPAFCREIGLNTAPCAQLQLLLPQPLEDGAGGHRDRDTICKPGSGWPPPVQHVVFIKNAQRSLQLSSAKHGVVACPQHPGKSQAGSPGCKAGAAA